MSSRLDALRARLAAAEKARDAAAAALSDDDKAEIELRRQVSQADEDRREQEHAKRQVDLDRREDEARGAYGDDAKLCQLAIDGYPDTFIVVHVGKAFAKWEHDITAAASNKKIDKAEVNRAYAVASVIDWNGTTDFGVGENGFKLHEFLKAQPAIVTPIVNAAAKLAGFFAEEKKS